MLLDALRALAARFQGKAQFSVPAAMPAVPALGMTPREAFFAAYELVPFPVAAGRIAAEQLMFYPPGIPILAPGDRIDQASLDYIRAMQELGLKVVGPQDTNLKTLKVVKES